MEIDSVRQEAIYSILAKYSLFVISLTHLVLSTYRLAMNVDILSVGPELGWKSCESFQGS